MSSDKINQQVPSTNQGSTANTQDNSSYEQYYYDPAYYEQYAAYYAQQQQQGQQYNYGYDTQQPSTSTDAYYQYPVDSSAAATISAGPSNVKKPKTGKIKSTHVDLSRKIIDAPIRSAGGEVWQDQTLDEWDPNDFRLFCGNLGGEVNDNTLKDAFKQFRSFQKAKVIRDKKSGRTKGYGFVSFKDVDDYTRAFREMNGKYVGNRPIKLSKSNWKDRNTTATSAKKLLKNGLLSVLTKD